MLDLKCWLSILSSILANVDGCQGTITLQFMLSKVVQLVTTGLQPLNFKRKCLYSQLRECWWGHTDLQPLQYCLCNYMMVNFKYQNKILSRLQKEVFYVSGATYSLFGIPKVVYARSYIKFSCLWGKSFSLVFICSEQNNWIGVGNLSAGIFRYEVTSVPCQNISFNFVGLAWRRYLMINCKFNCCLLFFPWLVGAVYCIIQASLV